jgi:hypothetical protein
MARKKKRQGSQSEPSPGGRGGLTSHSRIWLATLSTVVAIATGMFTLRDQIFPREAGTAAALSVPAYQLQVGRVCDEVNSDEAHRVKEAQAIKKRLSAAKTTLEQRNAMLDGVRRTTARSSHAHASLAALEPPPSLATVSHATEVAWERNLNRLRQYALWLDSARGRSDMLQAVTRLSKLRPAIGKDADTLTTGLDQLGGPSCRLDTARVVPTYTLPPLHGTKRGSTKFSPSVQSESRVGTQKASPSTVTPSTSTPGAAAPSPNAGTPGAQYYGAPPGGGNSSTPDSYSGAGEG